MALQLSSQMADYILQKEGIEMKKVIAILLVLVLTLGLCACGGETQKKESVKEKVEKAVRNRITATVVLKYGTSAPNITTYINEVDNNEYEVTGKVTVNWNGDSWSGEYEAEVSYDPDMDNCDVDLDLGDLYRR